MQLNQEDVHALDFLLNLMIERDSMVSGDDLKSFEKYQEEKGSVVYSEFKRLMFFFDYFDCGTPRNDGGLAEWIDINVATSQFKHSGGFNKAYENLQKDNESRNLESDLKSLQKESLEHSKTIREQEGRIRDLTEKLRLVSLFKQYWWVITTCIGIGWLIGEFLDKIGMT